MNINVRRFEIGDEVEVEKLISRALREVNIRDYDKEWIEGNNVSHDKDVIVERAKNSHMYVLCDDEKVVGVGAIAPYWGSEVESIILTLFINPDYKGKGLGRKIIEVLEEDEYFKRADRVEIPASITALQFYRHMGYGFKEKGNGLEEKEKGLYRLEKYPKVSSNNNDVSKYNLRSFIDNEYHNYYEFVYQCKKNAYKKYVTLNWGEWDEDVQRELFKNFIDKNKKNIDIIQLNGVDIGFYNGVVLDDGSYEIGNICIISEYQNRGIGTQVLMDILEKYQDRDIKLQYFKQSKVGVLYKKLGFVPNGESEFHYQMIKQKK